MTDELNPYQLTLRVELSARYHQQRQRVLLRRSRWIAYLNIALSMGIVAAFMNETPIWLKIGLPLSVSLATLADIVFGFTAQAYLHESLYRRYLAVHRDMATNAEESVETAFLPRILEIEADEPPVVTRAVNRCDNELLMAHGHPPAHKIGFLGRLAAVV